MDKSQSFLKIRSKRELTFLAIGILMLLIVLTAVAYSIRFLVVKLNIVLNHSLSNPVPVVRFEFQKVKDAVSQ